MLWTGPEDLNDSHLLDLHLRVTQIANSLLIEIRKSDVQWTTIALRSLENQSEILH
jgi:hypothetical protein